MGAGCVNAVSDAGAPGAVQLASTTCAGADQTHLAELRRNRGEDLSLRSDNNHPAFLQLNGRTS